MGGQRFRLRALKRGFGLLLTIAVIAAAGLALWGVPAPPSYTVEGMPRIGWRHVWRSLDVVRGFSARRQFAGWYGYERRMFVAAGTTNDFQRVDGPGAPAADVPGIPERAFGMQASRDVERPWVIYALDTAGDERYRFFRYDMAADASVALIDEPARAYAAGLDPEGRLLAYISNARNGVDSDVYILDVETPGPPRLVHAGGGDLWVAGWTGDGRLLVQRLIGIERSEAFLLDPASGSVQPLFPQATDGVVIHRTERARDGPTTFLAADLGGEFVGVHALDPATGIATPLTPNLPWDVEDLATLADGVTLALLVNEDSRHRLYLLDLRSGALEPAPDWPGGFPVRLAAHPSLPLVAIDVLDNAGVTAVWTYDAATRTYASWATADGPAPIPAPEVVRFPTFDTGPDGRARRLGAVVLRPAEPMVSPQPVLIDLHGGPTAQAVARVMPQDAVRGPRPVIIRPNVRGSTGYGATFAGLDDGMRRPDAVRDVGALLDWIGTQPDLDADRVAVMGASYGGFLALAALAEYGDRFRCGVDMFGMTDLPAAIAESDRGHYGQAQRGEYGDPAHPDVRRFLADLSPISRPERFTMPLLVFQGANDIRVKPAQSRRFVERVRAAGGTVVYLEIPNEGHGLTRPLTQFYFGVALIEFLSRCLATDAG